MNAPRTNRGQLVFLESSLWSSLPFCLAYPPPLTHSSSRELLGVQWDLFSWLPSLLWPFSCHYLCSHPVAPTLRYCQSHWEPCKIYLVRPMSKVGLWNLPLMNSRYVGGQQAKTVVVGRPISSVWFLGQVLFFPQIYLFVLR